MLQPMSNRLVLLAVEAAPVGMVMIGRDGTIQLVNSKTEELFGYRREELRGQLIEVLLPERLRRQHPDVRESFFADPRTRAMGQGRELYAARQDGSEFPVEIGLNPLTTEEGTFVLASIIDITERRQAEQTQRHLAALVESSDDAILSKDLTGTIRSWNQGAQRIFGYSAEEMLGRSITLLIPPERRGEEEEILRRLRRGERVDHFETVRLTKDGRQIHVSVTISPIRDSAGEVIGASKIVRDITERRRLAADLLESESRKSAILDSELDCIITIDHEGRVLEFNPAAERTFGYRKEQVLHQRIGELIVPPSLRDAHYRGMEHYLATGEGPVLGKRIEISAMRADGTEFPVELSITAMHLNGPPAFTARLRDITERNRVAAALAERSRLAELTAAIGLILNRGGSLQQILQSSVETLVRRLDGAFARIWTLSESGQTLELQASAGMYTHLDGPHGKVPVGKFKIGLIAQERNPHLTNEVVGDPRVGDQEWARREGMVSFAGYPLVVEDRLLGVVAMFARHPLSEATLAYLGTAADSIAVGISRKQTEEALIRSELRAQASNLAKSEFLANMSHEIRTPMNAIMGMTELVLETELSPLQREHLRTVRDSSEALLTLINDILDLSKIEAGKLAIEPYAFALEEQIFDTLRPLAMRAHEKGLELACDIHPDVPAFVRSDPTRLGQILLNLVGNAVKFTASGEVLVTVDSVAAGDAGAILHFAVADTGIGIAEQNRDRIFGAFEQADGSTTRKFGGTGLGLAVCSKLAAMLGGAIRVESQLGQGSTFHLTVRVEPAQDDLRPFPGPPVRRLDGVNILVVEGHATNRRILQATLQRWGMVPTCVAEPREALAEIARARELARPFQLLLLDLQRLKTDDAGLLQQVAGDPRLDGRVVLLIRTSERVVDLTRPEYRGVAARILKPVKPSELRETLTTALQGPLAAPAPWPLPAAAPGQELPPLRILLAEDSLLNQKLAVALLKKHGHQVVVTNNGREAVAALETEHFDLVLMDIQMPEMDGFEATAAIRAREGPLGLHTPIIAMTAHAMKGDRERCLAAGLDDYVSKPVRSEQLFDAIGLVFRERGRFAGQQTVPTRAARAAIDWDTALRSLGDDPDLLKTLVEAALDECPRMLESVRQAVADADSGGLHLSAHTLKGAIRYFGCDPAFDCAFQLERMGRDGHLGGSRAVLAQLETEMQQILQALCDYVVQGDQL